MAKILIVEDEPEIAEGLAALLKAQGHAAVFSFDGAEALAMARKSPPDLVLLDVMLPRLSGYDVCRAFKADPKLSRAKIVMVTGLGRVGDVETALQAGADDYLVKPYDTPRLLRKIEKVLGR